MARGDHLRVNRGPYYHHGIDLGDGTVAHFSGEPLRKAQAKARRASWPEFERGSQPELVSYPNATLHPDHTCVSALGLIKLGAGPYNLFTNNCEHLATFCKTGSWTSQQVDAGLSWYGRRLHIALRSPEAAVALPLGDVFVRGTKTALHLMRRFMSPPTRDGDHVRGIDGFYRAGRWWQDEQENRFFEGMTPGWWFSVDAAGVFSRCEQPSQPLHHLYQSWMSATESADVLETANGWFVADDEGTWQPISMSWTPGTQDPRMARAPLAALNAYLEAARDLNELHAAINEVTMRQPRLGDHVTYRALSAVAVANVGGMPGDALTMALSCRRTALWALAALNASQHVDVESDRLPGFDVIRWALAGGDGSDGMPLDGVHALGVLMRPTDPVVRELLIAASASADPRIADAANKYLQEPFQTASNQ